MQTIDTRGKICPAPLIMTKQAIKVADTNTSFTVICDNETAKNNLVAYLNEMGLKTQCTQHEKEYNITFSKTTTTSTQNSSPEKYCSSSATTYVVAIKSEYMGGGDEILGAILMRAFINSLPEAEKLPSHIVIYNSGVRIALNDCDTALSLEKLTARGVQIIICGTCIDYYNVKEKLYVGSIGNMYKITEILSNAGHVVYP